jgi:hypothetical protein
LELTPDLNDGEPWSKMDVADLTNEIAGGASVDETSRFLCGSEIELSRRRRPSE